MVSNKWKLWEFDVLKRDFNLILFVAILSAITFTGCGRSEFDRRLNEQAEEWNNKSPYTVLYAPMEIPDSPFKIRIPKLFKELYGPNSAHPDDFKNDSNEGQLIAGMRFHPSMLPLPGNKICAESYYATKSGDDYPYYCYLAAGPLKDPKVWAAKRGEIAASLKKSGFKVTDWKEVDDAPLAIRPGEKSKWKKLTAVGDQHFFMRRGGERTPVTEAGTLELYANQTETYFILVGSRIAEDIADKVKLSDAVQTAVNTVEVGEMKAAEGKDKANEKSKEKAKDQEAGK